MLVLILGLVLFLGIHSTRIVAPDMRARLISAYGDNAWKGVYSVIAIVGVVLIAWGYGMARADPIVVWQPPVWTRHLTMLLMLPVFVMVAAAYMPGRIQTALKHPMLVGVKLWAAAHLLSNGTLADIVLFGGFLAWAVADRISLKRRPAAQGPAVMRPGPAGDAAAIIVGLAVYLLFVFYLHEALFGVPPV